MSKNDWSHEILVMHLDVQRAAAQYARTEGVPVEKVTPWNSENELVRNAWASFTDPSNLAALEEWLEAVHANDESPLWSEEALKQCRERAKGTYGS